MISTLSDACTEELRGILFGGIKLAPIFFSFHFFGGGGIIILKKRGGSNLRALRCKHLKPKNRKHHMKLFLMTFVEIPKQHNYIWIALRHSSNSQISNTPSLDHCLQILDWGSQERET